MEKNYTLNFVKFLACIMVVLIHCKFPGDLGLYTTALARFAVPFFFMVSGYYAYRSKNTNEYTKKQIIKITKIAIIALIAYFIYNLLYNYIILDNKNFITSFFH